MLPAEKAIIAAQEGLQAAKKNIETSGVHTVKISSSSSSSLSNDNKTRSTRKLIQSSQFRDAHDHDIDSSSVSNDFYSSYMKHQQQSNILPFQEWVSNFPNLTLTENSCRMDIANDNGSSISSTENECTTQFKKIKIPQHHHVSNLTNSMECSQNTTTTTTNAQNVNDVGDIVHDYEFIRRKLKEEIRARIIADILSFETK